MRDDLEHRVRSSFAAACPPGEVGPAPELPPLGDAFMRDCWARAERVVAPAMAEVDRLVERHGRFFSIERTTCRGVAVPASVQMNAFRRHRTVNFENGAPHFDVVCDAAGRRALFRRTPLLSGAGPEDGGARALDALTRDLVQDRVAALLDVLART